MSAEISTRSQQSQLVLLDRIEDDTQDVVTGAAFTTNEDGLITVSEDKSVRIWLKRETGQYWPSVCHFLQSPCSTMVYSPEKRLLFVGQDNGNIDEFEVSDDYNRIEHNRKYLAHQKQVTGCIFTHAKEILVTSGKDKYITWHWTQNGQRLSGYQTLSNPLCLQYDDQLHYVFVGLANGEITVLKIDKSDCQLITSLNRHSSAISSLCWNPDKQLLYSGSNDKKIIIWNIGNQEEKALELQGHVAKVTSIHYAPHTEQLASISYDGTLVVWNMTVNRNEAAKWQESDQCMKCQRPFFWNLKQMWTDKVVGLRQHHCRKCGKALCASCTEQRTKLPLYGFEFDVRVCDECFQSVSDEDREPTASFYDMKQNIVGSSPDWKRGLLITSGSDRILKLWNVKQIFRK